MLVLIIVWFVVVSIATISVNLMDGTSDMDLLVLGYKNISLHFVAAPRFELFTLGIHLSPDDKSKRCFYLCVLNIAFMYEGI